MTAWFFLRDLHVICQFQTREGSKVGPATRAELKRWLQNKAVEINGKRMNWDEEIEFPITSFILFPNKPTTIV